MEISPEVQQENKKASIIDGKAIAQTIHSEITAEVKLLSLEIWQVNLMISFEFSTQVPGLAVVIVGSKKDSQTYVNMKRKACAEVGIKSFNVDLPAQSSEVEVIAKVHNVLAIQLYACFDKKTWFMLLVGILVQLPLPSHIGEENVLSEVSIEKDVDVLHPLNIGKLAMKGKEPLFQPCTPKSKRAVVVGRSNIVGLPLKGDWIKPGAVVIDVGTNTMDDTSRKSGYKLVGDVDFGCVSKSPIRAPFNHAMHSLNINILCHACFSHMSTSPFVLGNRIR
ncbi:hypothetical protein MKX03_017908 [Papaver bracteatum]|nr:hypothetical protein MKX03_017908 [Papaver bracteatum]